jgi:Na+/H+-dicarboxylate symporter
MLPAMSANGPAPPKVPFYAVILGAMILGLVAGPWLGAYTAIFGEVGKVVINAIKAAATPLLFFAIVHAILKTEVNGKAALRMVGIATTNTSRSRSPQACSCPTCFGLETTSPS